MGGWPGGGEWLGWWRETTACPSIRLGVAGRVVQHSLYGSRRHGQLLPVPTRPSALDLGLCWAVPCRVRSLRSHSPGGSSPPSRTNQPHSSLLSSRVAFLASHFLIVLGRPRAAAAVRRPWRRWPPCLIPASPEGDLQPQGAAPRALCVLVPQCPALSAELPAVRAASAASPQAHTSLLPNTLALGAEHLPHL